MKLSSTYVIWMFIYGILGVFGIYLLGADLVMIFFTHSTPFDADTSSRFAQLINTLVCWGIILGPFLIFVGFRSLKEEYLKYEDSWYRETNLFYNTKNKYR